MKKIIGLLVFFTILVNSIANAQDTFSIVAVDEETGEIGSAGASCVENADQFGGVILISSILPGRGAINGQASICIPHVNLNNGIDQMEAGNNPQEILDWLFTNDACGFGGAQDRQYGIVDLDPMGLARSAAFTGTNTLSYAGQRVGTNYAIQGNILLGPEILDSMEYYFLNTNGTLAEKLMGALQGANVPGADSRCLDEGVSSKSAFLQVYQSDDSVDDPFLRINVQLTPFGVEPIDSVQLLFEEWLGTTSTANLSTIDIEVYPNPVNEYLYIKIPEPTTTMFLQVFDITGKLLFAQPLNTGTSQIPRSAIQQSGLVIYNLSNAEGTLQKNGKLFLK